MVEKNSPEGELTADETNQDRHHGHNPGYVPRAPNMSSKHRKRPTREPIPSRRQGRLKARPTKVSKRRVTYRVGQPRRSRIKQVEPICRCVVKQLENAQKHWVENGEHDGVVGSDCGAVLATVNHAPPRFIWFGIRSASSQRRLCYLSKESFQAQPTLRARASGPSQVLINIISTAHCKG